MNIKKFVLSVLIASALFLSACAPESIENGLTKAAVGSATARQVVTIQHQFGRIDDTAYRADLLAFKQFNTDLDALGDDLVALGTVTPENRQAVLDKLDKLITDVDALGAGAVGLKSPQAQAAFSTGIAALRAGLRTARNIIAALKKPTPVVIAMVDRLYELKFAEVEYGY